MADETEVVEDKKSGGNPMMMVLIALIVILMLAMGGIGYLLYSKGFFSDQPTSAPTSEMADKKEASDGEASEFFKAKIENLVLNITNAKGKEKLMKLSFSLKSVEPTIAAVIENSKEEIVDIVIQNISARSSEELLTAGGKELLKEELLDEINAIVNEATASNEDVKRNNIKKLFFTTFVIK